MTVHRFMFLTGIGDEAGASIDSQIKATKELGWKYIEMRAVEVPGFPKANLHDIPEAAFDIAGGQTDQGGVGGLLLRFGDHELGQEVEDPFDITLGEVKRAIPRMQKLNTQICPHHEFQAEGR